MIMHSGRLCTLALVWRLAACRIVLSDGPARHVVIELGSNVGDWMTPFLKHHPGAVPIMVEPQPRFAKQLAELARLHNGTFYAAAAWSSNEDSLLFFDAHDGDANVGSSLISAHATAVVEDGFVPKFSGEGVQAHVEQISVPAIDVVEIIERHVRPGDEVTLRMDIEGAEYEVLRRLLVSGVGCTVDHYVVESHALYAATKHLHLVDLVLGWLLEGCKGRLAPPTVELEVIYGASTATGAPTGTSVGDVVPGCGSCPLLDGSLWYSRALQSRTGA